LERRKQKKQKRQKLLQNYTACLDMQTVRRKPLRNYTPALAAWSKMLPIPVGRILWRQISSWYLCEYVSPEERTIDESNLPGSPVELSFLYNYNYWYNYNYNTNNNYNTNYNYNTYQNQSRTTYTLIGLLLIIVYIYCWK